MIYCDTSFLLPLYLPDDHWHKKADAYHNRYRNTHSPDLDRAFGHWNGLPGCDFRFLHERGD